jgi:hypothetical protein
MNGSDDENNDKQFEMRGRGPYEKIIMFAY